jgi:hypothetical protein
LSLQDERERAALSLRTQGQGPPAQGRVVNAGASRFVRAAVARLDGDADN